MYQIIIGTSWLFSIFVSLFFYLEGKDKIENKAKHIAAIFTSGVFCVILFFITFTILIFSYCFVCNVFGIKV